MKILAITSHYPPYHLGGYEIRCKNILDELCSRGHEILVITSKKESGLKFPHPTPKYEILRKLHVRTKPRSLIDQLTRWRQSYLFGMLLAFARELFFDLQNMGFVDRWIRKFQPDVIYLGHITCLSKAIMPYFSACKIPIIYDEGGSGLIDSWVDRGIIYKLIEEYASRYSLLNKIKTFVINIIFKVSANRIKKRWAWPGNMDIFFNSELNQKNAISWGVPVENAKVIHSGVDAVKFSFKSKAKLSSPPLFILPGRIEPRKGQIDAVRLIAELRENGIDGKAIFLGKNWVNSYYIEVVNEIKSLSLEDRIAIRPMLAHEQLVNLYHEADFCFFPSYFKTGFSRIPSEAMASRCIIISYGNEGSNEIIRNKQTGFLVPPGCYQEIVNIINELTSNPQKAREITYAARKEIEEDYSMQKYINQIEKIVMDAAVKESLEELTLVRDRLYNA